MRALLLSAAIVLPLTLLACDMLKKKDGGADAAVDAAAAAVVVADAAPAAPATATATATAATTATVAPLGGGVHPVVAGDAGKPATDAGAVATDAGAAATDGGAAPAPTPTFQLPTAIPGFDAGAFKPPPGFPTALPSGLLPPQPKK